MNTPESPKTILIVEDEVAISRSLFIILSKAGFTVLQAYDGESGLYMARKSPVDLIILDVFMPNKDGFTMLEELRGDADDALRHIPVIMYSNFNPNEVCARTSAYNVSACLAKASTDIDTLLSVVKRELERAEPSGSLYSSRINFSSEGSFTTPSS